MLCCKTSHMQCVDEPTDTRIAAKGNDTRATWARFAVFQLGRISKNFRTFGLIVKIGAKFKICIKLILLGQTGLPAKNLYLFFFLSLLNIVLFNNILNFWFSKFLNFKSFANLVSFCTSLFDQNSSKVFLREFKKNNLLKKKKFSNVPN